MVIFHSYVKLPEGNLGIPILRNPHMPSIVSDARRRGPWLPRQRTQGSAALLRPV